MCIYLVLQIIIFGFVIYTYNKNIKIKNRYLLITCILWALLYGLRGYVVGNDTSGYALFFENQKGAGYGTIDNPDETLEWGFILIAKILSLITNWPTFFFLVQAFAMYFLIYNEYKGKYGGLWGLLCFTTMSESFMALIIPVRQSFSIIIVILSLLCFRQIEDHHSFGRLLRNKWFWTGILLFIFSINVHRSSIILFPLLLLIYFVPLNKFAAQCIVVIVFVTTMFLPDAIGDFFDLVLSQVSGISDETVNLMASRYAFNWGESGGYTWLKMFSWCVPFFVTITLTEKKLINSFNFKCLIMAFILYVMLGRSTMVIRISLLFQVLGFMMFIPNKVFRDKKLAGLYLIFTVLFIYSRYAQYIRWNTLFDTNIPYYFFWEHYLW